MHALIVVSHPDPSSLTHAVATGVGEGIACDKANSFEIADIAAEGFDPRFTAVDLAVHRRQAAAPADVVAEQARIDRADALVLVYPVYWWSMPSLLKGWIDRVFSNGWAYDEGAGMELVKKLHHLPVHLIAIGGADMRTYARHGYFGAMKMQIDHGIFGYCGARVVTSELIVEQSGREDNRLETARSIGCTLFSKKTAQAA